MQCTYFLKLHKVTCGLEAFTLNKDDISFSKTTSTSHIETTKGESGTECFDTIELGIACS